MFFILISEMRNPREAMKVCTNANTSAKPSTQITYQLRLLIFFKGLQRYSILSLPLLPTFTLEVMWPPPASHHYHPSGQKPHMA